jgi:hypothetical protein
MANRTPKPNRQPPVPDEITTCMRELSRIMDEGKTPEQMFTVRRIEVPEIPPFTPDPERRRGRPRRAGSSEIQRQAET